MYITFTGAQSTGKSTLIEALKNNNLIKDHFNFIESITRKIKAQGFKINEEGDDQTQLAMLRGHLSLLENQDKDCIADRCLVDVCAYTLYLFETHKVSAEVTGKVLAHLKKSLCEYDVIFYLVPEFGVVADGTRSESITFRDRVADIYEMLISMIKTLGKEVYKLTGSVEERIDSVYKVLRERGVKC